METTTSEYMTVAEAAEMLGVHVNTIRNFLLRGQLPAQILGTRMIRIRKTDLETLWVPYVAPNTNEAIA